MSKGSGNPVIPPRPDVPYVSSTNPPPPPQRTYSAGKTPNRRDAPSLPSSHPDPDWGDRDDLKLRELEEARLRVAQMEKTMRWWSDCTSNWREKWSKVRNERNKVREECRQLRAKLESAVKACSTLKRDKSGLQRKLAMLEEQLKDAGLSGLKDADGTNTGLRDPEPSICSSGSHKSTGSDQELSLSVTASMGESAAAAAGGSTSPQDMKPTASISSLPSTVSQDDFVSKLMSRKERDRESSSSSHSENSEKKVRKHSEVESTTPTTTAAVDSVLSPGEDSLTQKVTLLQMKLEESQKCVLIEQE